MSRSDRTTSRKSTTNVQIAARIWFLVSALKKRPMAHEHHAHRRQADRPGRRAVPGRSGTSPGDRGTAGRVANGTSRTRYITTPAGHFASTISVSDDRHGQQGLDRAASAAPRRRVASSGPGSRRAPRTRRACCPRCRCSSGREGWRTRAGAGSSMSTSSQKLSQAIDLKGEQDEVGDRAEEVGAQLAGQQGGDVSHGQTASRF